MRAVVLRSAGMVRQSMGRICAVHGYTNMVPLQRGGRVQTALRKSYNVPDFMILSDVWLPCLL